VKRLSNSRLAVCVMVAGLSVAAVPAWADTKIGVVNFVALLEESPQGKSVLESMRAEFAPRERTLQAQQQALKAKQDKLQKDSATMTEDQRARAEKDLRDGARDFERAKGEFQDDVTARRNEEMSRLQRTLIDEVRTYAKAQGYDLIISSEAAVSYAQAIEVTPAILAALQSHAGVTPAAAPKPGSATAPAKPTGK
jgi:outer membrane protein